MARPLVRGGTGPEDAVARLEFVLGAGVSNFAGLRLSSDISVAFPSTSTVKCGGPDRELYKDASKVVCSNRDGHTHGICC